ncbi:MAG: cytochrome P450 [Variovorax sp.]
MNAASAPPADPIAAVVHPDPYPYYADLRAGPPLVFHPALKLWVASRADVVAQALSHPALRVRPPAEPVPRAIAGAPAGEVFARLVRMNDGPLHARHRPVLQRALAGIDLRAAHDAVRHAARRVGPMAPDDAMFVLPLGALATLLGFADEDLADIAAEARAFVACLSPLATQRQLDAASASAQALRGRFAALPTSARARRPGNLLDAVLAEAGAAGATDADVLRANLVGLFSQTCESTAGLFGQSVVALARDPQLAGAASERRNGFSLLVQEVARHDAPVQNTRRFAAQPCRVAGVDLQVGDGLLLVLGAANRDAALNPEPETFRLERVERRMLGFGRGKHGCPGQALAFALAGAGVQVLLERGLDTAALADAGWRYRPSVNGRMPAFD